MSRSLLLGDEMRLGKTVQSIAAAEQLFLAGELDRVVVIAPAQARAVWADPDPSVGQVAKFATVPSHVLEFKSGKCPQWGNFQSGMSAPRYLKYIVTNYELVRRAPRLATLMKEVDKRTALVLDESIAIANTKSAQHKACRKLRGRAGWAWLLNGTPSGDNPEAIFGQFTLMDPDIIGTQYITHFRARYAKMDPFGFKVAGRPVTVAKWINLDDLSKRTAPYVLRRTMDQVFDLPPALDPVVREVKLRPETWRIYKEMKKEALAWLDENRLASAMQAGTKALRLAQITSGYVGGVETPDGQEYDDAQPVGDEKLEAVLADIEARLYADPNWKGLIWTRFRPEAVRMEQELAAGGRIRTKLLVGSQSKLVRADALRLLNPETAPDGPAGLVGTEATGKYAFNFAAASDVLYVSNDWSLLTRDQSMARVLGSAQKRSVLYTDYCAVGPKGEKTVDHVVIKALHEKRDLAHMTASEWTAALKEE